MRISILTVIAGCAIASAALAQPPTRPATICLDPSGQRHPAICHTQTASRFATPPDICHCEGPYTRVEAPWCAKGEIPPGESAAFDRARAAAAKDGTLVGDTYKGRPMCERLSPNGR